MEYYERLRQTREDRDITQEQAAEIAQCVRKQMSRYERGEQEMTVSKLKRLCLFYHVSADYILGLPRGLNWPR